MSHFETRPSFLHWNSAKLFATLKAPVFITWSQCVPCVSMLQRTRHASIPSTCATPCNAMQRHATPCNAMLHCFHSKHFLVLLRFAFSTGSSSFVLKKMSFSQQIVFDIFALENGWRSLQTKRSCENTKCRAKQSEDLHRFCWLHFCKEVLGSLLKVWHRTGMPEVARDWVLFMFHWD